MGLTAADPGRSLERKREAMRLSKELIRQIDAMGVKGGLDDEGRAVQDICCRSLGGTRVDGRRSERCPMRQFGRWIRGVEATIRAGSEGKGHQHRNGLCLDGDPLC